MRFKKIVAAVTALAITVSPMAVGPAAAKLPGCVGKMWNPLTDLDFRLMGGVKVGPTQLLPSPSHLGNPPKHKATTICGCKDGLDTGGGTGMTFWLPAYINDVARQAGCFGFLGGLNILPGFISLSSGQAWGANKVDDNKSNRRSSNTNMQIHYAYADIISIAGKSVFEKCGSLSSGLKVSYLTEPDFVFQNDIYSTLLSPQVALLAAVPVVSQIACGGLAMANTLGAWQNYHFCGWESTLYPLTGNTEATNSAQVTNMDITTKYLTRSALIGTTMRTYGTDVQCKPKYAPFYDPFQHRYQWSFPTKASTRYNTNMVLWGMAIKAQGNAGNFNEVFSDMGYVDEIDGVRPGTGNAAGVQPASDSLIDTATKLLGKLPKPLNYPTKEAGFMQVWEAKSCCLVMFNVTDLALLVASMGTSLTAQLAKYANLVRTAKDLYDVYKFVEKVAGIAAVVVAVGTVLSGSMGAASASQGLAESATDTGGEGKKNVQPSTDEATSTNTGTAGESIGRSVGTSGTTAGTGGTTSGTGGTTSGTDGTTAGTSGTTAGTGGTTAGTGTGG